MANGNQPKSKGSRGGKREGAGRKPFPRLAIDDWVSPDPRLSDVLQTMRDLLRPFRAEVGVKTKKTGGRVETVTIRAETRLH